MQTGRRRVKPALRAASKRSLPRARSSLAKTTMRMELAVATPMVMMAPMSEGTLKVVWVRKSIQRMPEKPNGIAMRMMRGSSQLWKLTAMSR